MNCGRQYCDKTYRNNSLNKISQQHKRSVRQKYWSFEMPLTVPAKITNSQASRIPTLCGNNLKCSQYAGRCKGHSVSPLSLEPKVTWISHGPLRVRPSYSSGYFKHYCKFQHAHNHTLCANYAENLTDQRICYFYAAGYIIHRALNWLFLCQALQ